MTLVIVLFAVSLPCWTSSSRMAMPVSSLSTAVSIGPGFIATETPHPKVAGSAYF